MTDADAGAKDDLFPAVTEQPTPLILLIDPDPVRRVLRAAEIRRAWARVAELPDASRVSNALRAAQVDVVVVCTDDPTYCQQLVHECRAQITESEQSVPLIAWHADPRGPCGTRALMLHIGADSVLEAPSTTTDLLACTFALRRLMRDVQFKG